MAGNQRPFLLFPLIALLATPALAADAANGGRIAQRWCAECHVVTPGQTGAKADAPPFATIAARGATTIPLDRFLMNPHPKMPDMQLNRNEVADIAAYIATLKK